MPKLGGLFDYFPELANIEVSKLACWVPYINPQILANKLGNRILYPQALPLSSQDQVFDLCLLREALKLQPQNYCNQNLKRIFIAEELMKMFPNLKDLSLAFVDVFCPFGLTSFVTRYEHLGFKNLGTLIRPEISSASGSISLSVAGKKYQIKIGSLVMIPAAGKKVDIKFESNSARLLGRNLLITEVGGGEVGLIIDTRKK